MPNKTFFPFVVIIALLIVDSFLINELTLEQADKKFPAFCAKNFAGEILTEKIFMGKVTVLCIWDTKNNQCADLLKKLAALAVPSNVQIIGLVGDKNFADAEKIAIKNSPSIPQILANDDFLPILSKIRAVPTTILIDEGGNLIGQPVTGAEIKFIQLEISHALEKNSPRSQALRKIHAALFR